MLYHWKLGYINTKDALIMVSIITNVTDPDILLYHKLLPVDLSTYVKALIWILLVQSNFISTKAMGDFFDALNHHYVFLISIIPINSSI